MKSELPIRLVLIDPPMKIDYGLQRGRGSNYEAVFVQQSKGGNVTFDFSIAVSENGKDSSPNFSGEFVQGTPARRFIYVDVGAYAGQKNTPWSRRMIVRLDDIGWPVIRKAIKPGQRLEARIPGTGSDGGPSCATVNPIGGWKAVSD